MHALLTYDYDTTERTDGELRAVLAANNYMPMQSASDDEHMQMSYYRVSQAMNRWAEMHSAMKVPMPGTMEFRDAILAKVFTERELQVGTWNFLFTNPENLKMMELLYRIPYFMKTQNMGLADFAGAFGKMSRNSMGSQDINAFGTVSDADLMRSCGV